MPQGETCDDMVIRYFLLTAGVWRVVVVAMAWS